MKIVKNTSAFDTRFLRTLFCKTHRVMARYEGKCRHWKRLQVTVRSKYPHAETSAYSGRATIDGSWMFLSIGRGMTTSSVAGLFWHEMMHVYGYKSHRGGRCDPYPDYVAEICKGLPERPPLKKPKAQVAAKPPKDIVAKRWASILTREARWTKKLEHAQKQLAKVQKERRTYRRRHGARLATS